MFGKPKAEKADTVFGLAYVAEPKVDGFRVRIQTERWSQRIEAAIGRKRDYTHHFEGIKMPPGCVFDAEVVVNGSLQETSKVLSRQQRTPYQTMDIYVFDILEHRNGYVYDLRGESLSYRRHFLDSLAWATCDAKPIEQTIISTPMAIETLAQGYIAQGWEGVVVKALDQPYGSKWFKFKRQQAEDFLVTRYIPGRGEWVGTIGAIGLAELPRQVPAEPERAVGQCSVGSNDLRLFFTDAMEAGITGIIVEVEYQQRTADGQLRHPRLLRVRHDLMEVASDLQR